MTEDLKEKIAAHIEGEDRTESQLAPIPQFATFKKNIQTDVELAKQQLAGNLQEILVGMNRWNEFQSDHVGDLRSAVEILIVFFCKKWDIKTKKRSIR